MPRFRLSRLGADLDEPQAVGEGLTRTSSRAAVLWAAEVGFLSVLGRPQRPMRCTVRATSRQQALQFLLRRHPSADPETTRVLGRA